MKKRPFARRRKRPVLRNTQVFLAIGGKRDYTITNGKLGKYFDLFVDEKYINPEDVGKKENTIIFLFFSPPADSKIKINY